MYHSLFFCFRLHISGNKLYFYFFLSVYANAYTRKGIFLYNITEVNIMNVKDVVTERFKTICEQRNIKINELANISGVTPSTAYSMMDNSRRDVSIVTIKKFCDGLGITLGEFFSTEEFNNLEQEIK